MMAETTAVPENYAAEAKLPEKWEKTWVLA
jgi:hypothetical protein